MMRTLLCVSAAACLVAVMAFGVGCGGGTATPTMAPTQSAVEMHTGEGCGPNGCPIPGEDGKIAPRPQQSSFPMSAVDPSVPTPPASQPGK